MATPAFREIRASYDDDCITVYQAYNASIAEAAVKAQKLSASPLYRPGRATWIKPSWCWLMYRSGYSYKDSNQERILAIRMKHENFIKLLRNACPVGAPHGRGAVRDRWIEEWIESIEDVTKMAKEMKRKLDEDPAIGAEELCSLGLIPEERVYSVDDEIFERLEMGRKE
ncbi:hypothetical protein PRZ48_003269 [Zasmidium cellare]|uniref:ATP-dependent RNA helicase DHX8 n=1 Tax=Zasmidium cellare TaxID=395010 RepID=A0ABR0EUJ7_ZASCE|nr:hypothetical protein PRZ48_003269 [Zasmidium cellare]